MFSLYEGKINNKIPSKTIDFNTLINIIKTNPYNRDYNTIRNHKKGDIKYNQGKKKLVRCNPNCVLKYNSISGPNFQKNYDGLKDKYDERFKRMWEYYLLMCAGTFRSRRHQLWQLVLSKKGLKGGYSYQNAHRLNP